MHAHMKLVLCTPSHHHIIDDVTLVVLPGSEGEIGVLNNHAPVITALKAGIVTVTSLSKVQTYYVSGGFCDITPEQCLILTDDFENIDDIDPQKINAKINKIQEYLEKTLAQDHQKKMLENQKILKSKLEIINNLKK